MRIIMSLQLILGGSGAGKSTYLYSSIIEESINNPDTDYIIIVPEQYTMATQKRVVELHPRKGILNIDVISFERLAYRVFEEVGASDYPVLDDTGKNLIVRRILEQHKKELRFFSGPYKVRTYARQLIIRESNVTERSLVTSCSLQNTGRSDDNPNGFIIEQFTVLENKDIRSAER